MRNLYKSQGKDADNNLYLFINANLDSLNMICNKDLKISGTSIRGPTHIFLVSCERLR